jgi:hypothetical protein
MCIWVCLVAVAWLCLSLSRNAWDGEQVLVITQRSIAGACTGRQVNCCRLQGVQPFTCNRLAGNVCTTCSLFAGLVE